MSLLDPHPRPPEALQRPRRLDAHGHRRIDPFLWMHAPRSPAMQAHLSTENDYARAVLAPTEPLQEALYAEMLARIEETDVSCPVRWREHMYYSRTLEGAQYPVHCRKAITADGWEASPEEILLDENREAAGSDYYEIGDYELSPAGRYLAWTEDRRGDRRYRMRLRDLATGRELPAPRVPVAGFVWANDELTLFYVTEDARTQRAHRLWRHALFERDDTLIHEEEDARFSLSVAATRSRAFLLLMSASHTTSETWLLPADQPLSRWRRFRRRRAGIEYEVDHHQDKLLVRINDTGPNFRLIETPVKDWRSAAWRERIAHREDVVLEGIELYRRWLVASERADGMTRLAIGDLASGSMHVIAFDEPAHVVEIDDLPEWDTPVLRYVYESFTTPESLFEYDPVSRHARLLKQQAVPGGFRPEDYISARLMARAADGTSIPVSLVHRRGLARDGSAPVWLDGYGAYGIVNDPWFSTTRLSLLDRGWVFAIAQVRGGGELGQGWHDAGRLAAKPNSFSDYIACAQALIDAGLTQRGRILAQGGSAGGLLVAGALNLDSALFGAALLEVPFVDVVTTMLDPDLPLTVGEYEEWGDPRRRADYRRMLAWSPYDGIAPRPYPPLLIEAGLHDSQVMIWEPAKYAARIRGQTTSAAPVLLLTNMGAGHGGASGRYEQLRERARQIAFALAVLGPHSRTGGPA